MTKEELKKENKNLKGQVVTNDIFEDKKDKRIEELQNENSELKEDLQNSWKQANDDNLDYCKKVIDYEERIKKLEEKISNLLSCKNCPENKGGLICVKEYENKCLAQKIQFIKELQQEKAALEKERDEYRNMTFDQREQLYKAKEIIKKLKALYFSPVVTKEDVKRQDEILAEAEQFISEVEK